MTKNQEDHDGDESSSVGTAEAWEEMFGFQAHEMTLSIADDDVPTNSYDKNENDLKNEEEKKEYEDIDYESNSSGKIEMERVEIPPNCYRRTELNESGQYRIPPTAFYVHHVLSQLECQSLIQSAQSTSRGFQYIKEATHTNPLDGSTYTVPLMNPHPHKLSLFFNDDMLDIIWNRLKPILLQNLSKEFMEAFGPPLGLNPRLRILKYDSEDNDYFSPHYDATTTTTTTTTTTNSNTTNHLPPNTELQSEITVLLYLNQDFQGGRTLFLDRSDPSNVGKICPVKPRQGSILLFDHGLFHSGEAVSSNAPHGTKFILRTDVMFAKASPQPQLEEQRFRNVIAATDTGTNDDMEMNSAYLQTSSPADASGSQSPLNILQLCEQLSLSNQDIQLLDELQMLDLTVYSFCEPGQHILGMILKETGMSQSSIDALIKESFSLVQD